MSSRDRVPLFAALLAAFATAILFQLSSGDEHAGRLILLASGEAFKLSVENVAHAVLPTLLIRIVTQTTSPDVAFMLVNTVAGGLAVYLLTKNVGQSPKMTAPLILANIGFLFFTAHPGVVAMTLLWMTAVVVSSLKEDTASRKLGLLISGMGLGFDVTLGICVIIYQLWSIAQDSAPIQNRLRDVGLLALGVAAWMMLMMFLVGGAATSILFVGLGETFTRLNPLDFIVSVVVTLNLLLIPMFLSQESPRSRRLKPLLLILVTVFLFVRSEPQYVLYLLPICLVYVTPPIAGWKRGREFVYAYAVLNLVLFFLYPEPQPHRSLYDVRAAQIDDAPRYLNEYVNYAMPAYSRIRRDAAYLNASAELVSGIPKATTGSSVIVDPAMALMIDPRLLSRDSSQIGWLDQKRNRFTTHWGQDTSLIAFAKSGREQYYLSTEVTRNIWDTTLANNEVRTLGQVRLIKLDTASLTPFLDKYIYHYYRSYH